MGCRAFIALALGGKVSGGAMNPLRTQGKEPASQRGTWARRQWSAVAREGALGGGTGMVG